MSAGAIERARAILEARKREISDELRQIERALTGLKDHRRPARSRTRRRSAARSGQRGGRREQFLKALRENPGVGVSEIAKKIGVSPQHGHGIAKRLRQQGRIRKQGKGYAIKV